MHARPFRQVVALAEAGSFRHAAVVLAVSQPALSNAVSALQKRLRGKEAQQRDERLRRRLFGAEAAAETGVAAKPRRT